MKIFPHLFLLVLSSAFSFSAISGVQVGATRIIYAAQSDEVQLTVQSKNTKASHLVQAWVSNIDDQGSAPFIVTPPIVKLNADQEVIFHFIYVEGNTALPKDRESAFWANIKFIAGTSENIRDKSKLQLASRTRIKLFYRPTTLSDADAAQAFQKVIFTREANQLIISNPTAYYVTFNSMSVNGVKVEAPKNTLTALTMMVAPFSQINLPVAVSNKSTIKWNAISDFGSVTPVKEATLP